MTLRPGILTAVLLVLLLVFLGTLHADVVLVFCFMLFVDVLLREWNLCASS